MFGYTALRFILAGYESGKGDEQAREVERDDEYDYSVMGTYRMAFCIHISVIAAFFIEGIRFGGGWPTILLFSLGVGAGYGLSPKRDWMKPTR
jgi:hypothetical protein